MFMFFQVLTFPCTTLTDTSNSAFDIVVCTQISVIPFQTHRSCTEGWEFARDQSVLSWQIMRVAAGENAAACMLSLIIH